MKKSIIVLMVLILSSCAKSKVIDGINYRPYGFLNEEIYKDTSIVYEISGPAIVTSIIFCEIVIPPVYSIGYNLYEPVKKK